jgi:hypothetical protein
MLKLEYDDKGRVVIPQHLCRNRIVLSAHSETYCMLPEHDGPCSIPPEFKKDELIFVPPLQHGFRELVTETGPNAKKQST